MTETRMRNVHYTNNEHRIFATRIDFAEKIERENEEFKSINKYKRGHLNVDFNKEDNSYYYDNFLKDFYTDEPLTTKNKAFKGQSSSNQTKMIRHKIQKKSTSKKKTETIRNSKNPLLNNDKTIFFENKRNTLKQSTRKFKSQREKTRAKTAKLSVVDNVKKSKLIKASPFKDKSVNCKDIKKREDDTPYNNNLMIQTVLNYNFKPIPILDQAQLQENIQVENCIKCYSQKLLNIFEPQKTSCIKILKSNPTNDLLNSQNKKISYKNNIEKNASDMNCNIDKYHDIPINKKDGISNIESIVGNTIKDYQEKKVVLPKLNIPIPNNDDRNKAKDLNIQNQTSNQGSIKIKTEEIQLKKKRFFLCCIPIK